MKKNSFHHLWKLCFPEIHWQRSRTDSETQILLWQHIRSQGWCHSTMLLALVNIVVLDQNGGVGLVFSRKSQPHGHSHLADAPVTFSDKPVIQ